MALNKEDKADVSRSMGKALANKVSKVTKDGRDGGRQHASKVGKSIAKTGSYEMPEERKKHLYKTWLKADPTNPQADDWRSRIK